MFTFFQCPLSNYSSNVTFEPFYITHEVAKVNIILQLAASIKSVLSNEYLFCTSAFYKTLKYTSLYKWNKIQNLSYCWVFQVALLLWQKWVTPESTWLDLFEFSLDPQTSWKNRKNNMSVILLPLNLIVVIFYSFPVWENPLKFK